MDKAASVRQAMKERLAAMAKRVEADKRRERKREEKRLKKERLAQEK